MKAISLPKLVKSPAELTVSEVPEPACPDDAVVCRVVGIGLNFLETLMIQGKYQHKPKLPFIPGIEFSGIIERVGKKVEAEGEWKVGDKVFGGAFPGGGGGGCWAEKVVVVPSDYRLFHLPDYLTMRQACNVLSNYSTAWAGLVIIGRIKRGEVVLCHAGAGGVSLAAVQVAKRLYGCTVIATCGSEAKRRICLDNGADYAIDYTVTKDWAAEVKRICEKDLGRKGERIGVDLVYDPIAAINDSLRACAWGARIVIIGFASRDAATDPERVPTNRVLIKQVSLLGCRAGENARMDPSVVPSQWNGIFNLFASTPARPVTFPPPDQPALRGLAAVPRGLEMLASRQSYGKAVVELGTPEEMDSTGSKGSPFTEKAKKQISADWERRRAEKERELREFVDAGRPRL
ncbi:NADPH2:quinone reductase [Hyaloraphidium curvatum]|nr:NADPH2:quinone reductase [Hyaloraphidium curvatum]